MRASETTGRIVGREMLLALLVVALGLLNFGHASAVFAAGGRVVVTTVSICGDPGSPSAGDHLACHACRPDVAVLPPAPANAAPVCFAVVPVACAVPAPATEFAPLRLAAAPRGPPAA